MKRAASGLAAILALAACGPSQNDPASSVIAAASATGSYTYGFDVSGLLTSVGSSDASYALTRAGDTLTAGGVVYRFDALGRVSAIDDLALAYAPDGQINHATRGAMTVSYAYDESGARILKSANGIPTVAYTEDAWVTATELDEPVRVEKTLVGVLHDATFVSIATDMRGTPQADTSGVARPASPFGARPIHPDTASEIDYAAKGFDADLGADRMGARDYDARIGRFLEPDPLFLTHPEKCVESPVECSLYGYAKSNPATYVDPTGLWSSMWIPFFAEPVHQMAVVNVLKGVVSDRGLRILVETQVGVDQLQRPEDQPLHAMNGNGQDRAASIAAANAYVTDKLTTAKAEYGHWSGYVTLGAAIHTLQDATSPSHEGFQTYVDHYPHDVSHAIVEGHYPKAGTEDRKLLEGVTRWAHDIAVGDAPMPKTFFDERTGHLELPEAYRK